LNDSLNRLRINFKEHLLKYKSETTAKTYEYTVRRFLEYLEDNDLLYDHESVQAYINHCTERGLAASTVNKIYRALRSFATFTETEQAVDKIRVVKMPDFRNQAPKALRRLERVSLVERAQKDKVRNYAIIITLLNTGVRVSELVSMNVDDLIIVRDEGEVRIRQGKGNKERTLPLNKEARDALAAYLLTRKDNDPALFMGSKGRLGVRGVQYILKKYNIHPHQLRHTFITDLVRKHDLILVQFLSGHSSTDILARYSKPSKEDLQSAVENVYE
jgi:integrase/recombinase XerC/integrase/recombinase XerD